VRRIDPTRSGRLTTHHSTVAELLTEHDWLKEPLPKLELPYDEVAREYSLKDARVADPTTVILIDEADRLRMASLEQLRAIFDASRVGIVLIVMPGLEKRLARYAQFYSRIGFVHEFRPLGTTEVGCWLNDGHRMECICPTSRGPKTPSRRSSVSRAGTSGC